jgi:armadillo repeat-containing protein 6
LQKVIDDVRVHAPDVAADLLGTHSQSKDVASAAAAMCTAAAIECEDSKCQLIESSFPLRALEAAREPAMDAATVAALLTALKVLITNDDLRPPASKAFIHARILANDKGAVPVFVQALQRCLADVEGLQQVVVATQQLCANDDICKQV